ncbi:hypothetical protein AVEN_638-1 [Araneus ventricosus]|uniref:CCHC-type domain-containing protein n=1 Tax=Araneus ventricosus TaxID=182803 RepID=A0A4Y2EKI5_ARAVE|nr:hypothetical protein AVEN_638-1 [Araneus ventricosus]
MRTGHARRTDRAHHQNVSQDLLILIVKSYKYNPATDDNRDITCWRCGDKGHASFMCNLPRPQRGFPIAPLRNTSRFSQDSCNTGKQKNLFMLLEKERVIPNVYLCPDFKSVNRFFFKHP